jgi:hypothetical protein
MKIPGRWPKENYTNGKHCLTKGNVFHHGKRTGAVIGFKEWKV